MPDGAYPIFISIGGAHPASARGQVGNRQGDQARDSLELTSKMIHVTISAHADSGNMLAARGLAQEELRCRSGDVFLWHAQLLHGGRPIRDMRRTRSSLVVHYWRAGDLPAGEVRRDPACGAYLGRTLRGEIAF